MNDSQLSVVELFKISDESLTPDGTGKVKVNLDVYDRRYGLYVEHKYESFLRKAAKLINEYPKNTLVFKRQKGFDNQDIFAMVALQGFLDALIAKDTLKTTEKETEDALTNLLKKIG